MGHVGECPVQEYRLEYKKGQIKKNGVRNLLHCARRYKKYWLLSPLKKSR